MLDKFSERAKRAIYYANNVAVRFHAPAIEPEHLLLGLIREDAELFRALSANVADAAGSIRNAAEAACALIDAGRTRGASELPLSPASRKIVDIANRRRARAKPTIVGTDDLLLAIFKVENSRGGWFSELMKDRTPVAVKILQAHGINAELIADKMRNGHITEQINVPSAPCPPDTKPDMKLNALIEILIKKGLFTAQDLKREVNASHEKQETLFNSALLKILVRKGVLNESEAETLRHYYRAEGWANNLF